jgi:hypothetical protein
MSRALGDLERRRTRSDPERNRRVSKVVDPQRRQ